ncbi:LOW QUALITY PROTEIN: hypothetical protein Cgig2_021519 [Carnegiea gigantea]|uniref:3-ketoacyl-CoA synthase n=1 Tax=Carnegiea gigantea TaxID=171969 RepID=A0A9Q1KE54_9CARY|nr:LOW QUALITY PROTEIN: hypothetical protein Cgig2_021519 [Carnegiea gigantea]
MVKPNISQQMTRARTIECLRHAKNFTQETMQNHWKLLMSTGIGDLTYVPESYLKDPPDFSMEGARTEAEATIYEAADELLAKTTARVEHIGGCTLIACCSLFNPVPSPTAVIVSKYKLRTDIKSYNLSGMVCSAGIAATDLAKLLLQVNENMHAMVVSAEVIGPNMYTGNDLGKIITNGVFRVGGAAILLSNKQLDRHSSKNELIHTIRTNTTRSDTSYRCIFREEDSQRNLKLDAEAPRMTLHRFGNLSSSTVWYELAYAEAKRRIKKGNRLAFGSGFKCSSVIWQAMKTVDQEKINPWFDEIDDFIAKLNLGPPPPYFEETRNGMVSETICSNAITSNQDRGTLELERNLKQDTEPPRMILYRFRSLSSSTVWYELAYATAKRRVKSRDHLWQITFGSGFKCSIVIWHSMEGIDQEKINTWLNEIDKFPVETTLVPTPY